jgi:molybdopterin molybdotransferase
MFTHSKKTLRREYLRATLRPSADGFPQVIKFPRDGTGILSSLVQSDGLVELGEGIETVEPGQMVKFLPYASLV